MEHKRSLLTDLDLNLSIIFHQEFLEDKQDIMNFSPGIPSDQGILAKNQEFPEIGKKYLSMNPTHGKGFMWMWDIVGQIYIFKCITCILIYNYF